MITDIVTAEVDSKSEVMLAPRPTEVIHNPVLGYVAPLGKVKTKIIQVEERIVRKLNCLGKSLSLGGRIHYGE